MVRTKNTTNRKVGSKLEITETVVEEVKREYSLAELRQDLTDLKKSRSSLVKAQQDNLAVHDEFIAAKQKQINDAIALGIV